LDQRDPDAAVKFGIRMGLLVKEPKIPRIWFEDGYRYVRYGGDDRVKHTKFGPSVHTSGPPS